jgi:hypothetical protein
MIDDGREMFEPVTRRFAAVIARGHYRAAPDGQRFLVLAPLAHDWERPAAVVLNWSAALKN